MSRPLAAAILLVLALVPALRAGDPVPEEVNTLEGPLPPPYHSFGTACCQPASRNWWHVPAHAPHLGWQGYCGECNFQMPFGGCPDDYLEHHGCGPIDRLGYGVRGLLFGDDCCDSCGCKNRCGCERACEKPACGCERRAPKCCAEPVCGLDEVPPSPPVNDPFHDDPSVPPAPRPPMPPDLETELPQARQPLPLRSAGRAPAVIRTATHVEMTIDDDESAPRLLTPPVTAAPALRPAGPLPQIVTPARKLPAPEAPAKPISGNMLRFRLLK